MNRHLAKLALSVAVSLSAVCAAMADKSSDAIIRLLNSRAAGSPKDFAEAAEIVSADAENGRPLQKFVIALVSRDADLPGRLRLKPDKRREYLDQSRDKIRKLAEEKGNSLAWYLLSLEKNDLKCLRRAADGGNVQALNAWGTILLTSKLQDTSVETNELAKVLVTCFEMFKKAADLGDANGFYNLGMCHLRGYGCDVDQELAFQCFRTGALKGHPEAINNMGGFYRDGIVVEKNLETAARYFEKSASMDNPYGLLNYALALQRGEGVEKDIKKALEMLKKSAQKGNAEAMNAYGMCYFTGDGVKKNEPEAVKWFRASAARGFPPAMDNLAACYDRGLGVRKDEKEGLVWKVRGMAARGDRNAAAWLTQNNK